MESLKGKNALITVAGKGTGRAIAVALAQEGVNRRVFVKKAGLWSTNP